MKLPRVTEVLAGVGLSDFSKVPIDILEASSHFGTAVHLATQLDDLGTLDIAELSEPILPYLDAWRKFSKDYNLMFEKDEIEVSLVSTKWNFRGTPDRIAKPEGVLVDIKTGSSIYPSTAIQCAAYAILAEANGIRIKKRLCVQLKERGYTVTPYNDASDKSIFLSCLNIYNFKKRKGML